MKKSITIFFELVFFLLVYSNCLKIQPTKNTEGLEIKEDDDYIYFTFPKILDFTIKKEYTIYLLYKSKNYNANDRYFRLAPDLGDMNCVSSSNGYICTINSDYFENKSNGFYYLYSLNLLKTNSILVYEVPPFEVILQKTKTVDIQIKEKDNMELFLLGEKGIIYLVTDYKDNENIFNISDIEEKTKFETMIYDSVNSNTVNCRLWKPNNDNIGLICKLNKFYLDQGIFRMEKVSLIYKEYIINVYFETYLHFNKTNYEIPFLYSDRQIIDIKDGIESYDLKFNIEKYNNESLYLYGEVDNFLILDKCQKNDNELNCEISKEKLEEILIKNNEQFKVGAINNNIGLVKFIGVLNITINYKIIKKEDIFIGITGPLTNEIESGVPFGFQTNITNLPNIYSEIFDKCYFKKFNDNPLLFLCKLNEEPEEPFKFGNLTNELILDNIHYKYNFRIQPFEEIYEINIKGHQTNVKFILPEVLDFNSERILTITLIIPPHSFLQDVWLNPNSSSLECNFLNEVLKCNASLSHFVNKESGNYYLYYSKTEKYYDLSPIKVILPNSLVEIPVNFKDNLDERIISDKGLLYFITDYNDTEANIFDVSDIEEKTNFVTTLYFNSFNSFASSTNINCRLWKPLNEKLWLFCKLNESLSRPIEEEVKIEDAVFLYKEHTISIVFNYSYYYSHNYFRINVLNISVPLIYSDKQIINIKEEIDSYDLKFHIGLYNEQRLCLSIDDMKKFILQDCKENDKNLICNVKKEKFFEIYTTNEEKIIFYPCDHSLKEIQFLSAYDIIVNFDNIQKEDIYIGITRLLDTNINLHTYISYETNITNICDIISDEFELTFEGFNDTFSCRIKKSIQTPLLIICFINKNGTYYLKNITEEIILDNINVKYNFRIQPVYIEDIFEVEGVGNYIKFSNPMVLNYYLYDTINIDYYWYSYYKKPEILLNPDSDKLFCYDLELMVQRCIIPVSHFDGKEDGYYPIFYFNYLNNKIIMYQLSPIQVILPKENNIVIRIKKEDNNDIIKIGQKGILYLVTNFEDKNNIFNDTFIPFNSTIKDDNINEYNVNCKLWIPKSEKIRIMCKLNENLLYNHQNISLNKVEFIYNNFNITISQQDLLVIEQLNYDISFLYSDSQNIDIKEGKESYNIQFDIERYNDEILFIYGERNNSIILDNCEKSEKKLNCELSKEKLEKALIKNNEQFKVAGINDTIGIINFNSILNINITYEIEQKEDIYVEITELLSDYSQEGTPIAFKTNVTNIPNIISDIFNSCYFKKNNESPLLYLCNFNINKSSYEIDEELIMNNSHYKYNFKIQPTKEPFHFSIYSNGTNIFFVYPEILNFTSEESLTIRFIISNPSLAINLKFISDSDYLECKDINGLKKCIVPLSHFIGEKSGYYYLNQINGDKTFIHYELSPIKVILIENLLKIYVNDEDNKENIIIGKNGFFILLTNYFDKKNIFDISDIEEKTHFNTTISKLNDPENLYKVTCRLWKPKDDKIRLICKLNDEITNGKIKINSVTFTYKKYEIYLVSMMSYQTQAIITSENIPFIYSDKNIINIEEDKQFYDLKFKIEEYNNEILFLQRKKLGGEYLTELNLDDCNKKGKDLTCKIEKEKIIENLYYNGEIFQLDYYCSYTMLYKLSGVLDIIINYNITKKEDVFVGVTKLLQNNFDYQNFIPYETNITSISNVNSDFFYYITDIDEYYCKMKKSSINSLLFLCLKTIPKDKSSLGKNDTEVILDNIHIKYNFRIQPVNNIEEFTTKNEGSRISIRYPTKLDFIKSDSIQIYFYMYKPKNTQGIRLNPDSEELDCEYQDDYIKKCLVPKSHFEGKQNGYFYTYYLNEENKLNIFYDISPILVNLTKGDEIIINIKKEDNKNIIKIGNKGTLALITNFYDEHNIFDSSDIEENTKFKAEFIGNKNYEANCRLWKPKNEKIRMICKFNENLETNNIKLNRVTSEYKGKKFSIYSEESFEVEQLQSDISFLYSDKQEINIENDKDSYDIIFKKDVYYNEPLILFNNKMKMIVLGCNEQEKQIICNIKKDILLEKLSYNGENYNLCQLTNSEGLYMFNSVLNIIINYNNIEKKDIYIKITKLLTQFIEKNNFIVYETNITDINKITTDYFNLTTERNDNLECILKKDDQKLLLLCKALIPGKGYIGEIKELNLSQISVLYNLKIIESKNEEEYTISNNEGTLISSIYPEELNFNSQESYIIKYITDYPERLKGIQLNINSSDKLNCENKIGFKQCIVPKNHFNEEGYYYTYYDNSFGTKSIAYEAPKIKIILNNDESNKNLIIIIVCSAVGGLILIGIILFFLIRHYKGKKQNLDGIPGNEENIISFSTDA